MTVRAGVDTTSGKIFVEVVEEVEGCYGTCSQDKITPEQARMLAQQLEEAAGTIEEYEDGDFEHR